MSVTPNQERDAWVMAATMDHSSIRALGGAFPHFFAGLPRSDNGDHRSGCSRKMFEGSPHRSRYDFLLLAARGFGVVFANFRGSAAFGAPLSGPHGRGRCGRCAPLRQCGLAGKFPRVYSDTSNCGGANKFAQSVANIHIVDDKLAIRAEYYRYDTDGYVRNIAGNAPVLQAAAAVYGAKNLAVNQPRWKYHLHGWLHQRLWKPIDDLRVTLTYLKQEVALSGARHFQFILLIIESPASSAQDWMSTLLAAR
jgi:hypothetical protein